ncbi:MAG: c-type cytochrome domain-containing protein, partial [Planctomycetota bacterium]
MLLRLAFCALSLGTLPLAVAEDRQFATRTRPLIQEYCQHCHNADNRESGVRVDTLESMIAESEVKHWQQVRDQIDQQRMPPEDEPQPTDAERRFIVQWFDRALHQAKIRPQEYNGSIRRLTVAQYRNSLKELLHVDEDVASILP